MDVRLEDGTIIQNVPEGTTQSDLMSRVEKMRGGAPKEPTITERMASGALKGFMSGGAIPAMVRLGGVGLDVANEALTKGAYEAGGKTTELASKVGLPPEVAAGAGFAANVGLQAVPALIGGKAATGVAPSLESGAEKLMASALKPTLKDWKTGRAATAIQTMLDEGINVTPGGVMKLKQKIGELNNEIGTAIMNSTETINKGAVLKSLKETLEKFRNQVNPQADINAIKSAWNNFINHPLLPKVIPEQIIPARTIETGILNASGEPFTKTIPEKIIPASGTNEIPVQLAQVIKQGTYKQLAGKYGELGSAETEAQKALARGLKEGIAAAVPPIRSLNAEESNLINALNVVERRVLISANKNPAGLAWLTHNPASWAAFMADKSELFKSLVSRMIYSGAERVPQAITGTGIAVGQSVKQPQP